MPLAEGMLHRADQCHRTFCRTCEVGPPVLGRTQYMHRMLQLSGVATGHTASVKYTMVMALLLNWGTGRESFSISLVLAVYWAGSTADREGLAFQYGCNECFS
jgi:hypothetical protein